MASVAATISALVVIGAVWESGDEPRAAIHDDPATASTTATGEDTEVAVKISSESRVRRVSRTADRVSLRGRPTVAARKFAAAPLNLWHRPTEQGRPAGVLRARAAVAVTGVVSAGRAQILHRGQLRWVTARYVSDKRPVEVAVSKPNQARRVGASSCPDGSAVESGLTDSAVRLYRSACAAFPVLSSYGGYAARGEHSDGRAIDFMVPSSATGRALATWARANSSQLGLSGVIWSRTIWTTQRASEGWRPMEDRGSPTLNHEDHVHILVR